MVNGVVVQQITAFMTNCALMIKTRNLTHKYKSQIQILLDPGPLLICRVHPWRAFF